MRDWEYKNRPDAFCNVPQSEVAGRIGALIEHYRPQVVISYDPEGAYQHPDHVHAARCAAAAVAATGIPAKFYQTAMRRSDWRGLWGGLREQGGEGPALRGIDPATPPPRGEPDPPTTPTPHPPPAPPPTPHP